MQHGNGDGGTHRAQRANTGYKKTAENRGFISE
jgi:hypothetical protein